MFFTALCIFIFVAVFLLVRDKKKIAEIKSKENKSVSNVDNSNVDNKNKQLMPEIFHIISSYSMKEIVQVRKVLESLSPKDIPEHKEFITFYGKQAGKAVICLAAARKFVEAKNLKVSFNRQNLEQDMSFSAHCANGVVYKFEFPYFIESNVDTDADSSQLSRNYFSFKCYPNSEEAMLGGDYEETWRLSEDEIDTIVTSANTIAGNDSNADNNANNRAQGEHGEISKQDLGFDNISSVIILMEMFRVLTKNNRADMMQ